MRYMLYMLNIAQLNIAQFRNNLSHDCCCKLELTVTSYVALHGAICYILYLLYFIFGCARIPANSWADLCIFFRRGGVGMPFLSQGVLFFVGSWSIYCTARGENVEILARNYLLPHFLGGAKILRGC